MADGGNVPPSFWFQWKCKTEARFWNLGHRYFT